MVIGVMELEIFINDANSLKEKRRHIKSLIEKTKHKFNISIAEVDYNDLWQKSMIGISEVSNNREIIEKTFDKIIYFIDNYTDIEILNINREIY